VTENLPDFTQPCLRSFLSLPTVASQRGWLSMVFGSKPDVGVTFGIRANPAGLAPGMYAGTISWSLLYYTSPTVFVFYTKQTQVSLVIAERLPPFSLSPATLSFTTNAGSSPANQSIVVRNQTGAAFGLGIASTTTSGGSWLSADVSQTLPSADPLPIAVRVNSSALQPGTYAGNVRFSGGIAGGSASIDVPVSLTVRPAIISTITVVDAASFQPNRPVSPGSYISIFGTAFVPALAVAASTPFPNTLNGASVTIGGVPAPLYFVSGSQINAIVPYSLPVNTVQQLVVQSSIFAPTAVPVAISAANPAVFTVNQSGSGQGTILNADYSLNGPANPAVRGSVISIYCIGLGLTDPAIVAGTVSSAVPLIYVSNGVGVTVGGVPAATSFAGLAPGLVGLYQVNITVPLDAPVGGQINVVLTVQGQTSPPVTMAVK
jgi:uncharacterized protein (TIGR03437 family)